MTLKHTRILSMIGLCLLLLLTSLDSAAANQALSLSSWSALIITAFIGGLILNVMPCVLPVLSLKLSFLVNHSQQSTQAIRHRFLSSASGVVFSFWLLAGFVTLLKWGGHQIGWGIQFQSPGFLIFMALITGLFGANLFDFFDIRLPLSISSTAAQKGGSSVIGHFVQGMFATLLATPCSAPFLGTAVAFSCLAPPHSCGLFLPHWG